MSESNQPQSGSFDRDRESTEWERKEHPFSQEETIAILQEAIYQLERVLKKLDAEPDKYSLPTDSFKTLIASAEELMASTQKPQTQELVAKTTEIPQQQTLVTDVPIEKSATTFTPEAIPKSAFVRETEPLSIAPTWWSQILERIRSFLPAGWNESLSDTALTGMVAGIAGVLLFTFVFILPPKSHPESVRGPAVALETPSGIEGAKELASEPTPEQALIVAIENQVASTLEQYANELIISINPIFPENRAIVQLKEGWYELSDSGQDELANKLLDNARELYFEKIELTDTRGTLLARSPVIGKEAIVFQRRK